jgi:hypothetical protein|tara:strand:+ start:826 stop:1206 length:381 start_codon:yes stop_codon:yes gene_type:complete
MKRKAVQAELRKESKTFKGWLKYEVTIQNVNGSTEVVPAYGKDLQDALSRVAHDEKIIKLQNKTKRIPDIIWVILWFGYVLGWTLLTYSLPLPTNYVGIFFLLGLIFFTTVVVSSKTWFRKRNISK